MRKGKNTGRTMDPDMPVLRPSIPPTPTGSSNTAAARISGVPCLTRSRRSGMTGGSGSSLVRSYRILSAVDRTLDSTSETVRRPSSRPVRLMVSSTSMSALRRSW